LRGRRTEPARSRTSSSRTRSILSSSISLLFSPLFSSPLLSHLTPLLSPAGPSPLLFHLTLLSLLFLLTHHSSPLHIPLQDGLEYSSEEEAKTLEDLQKAAETKKKAVVMTDHKTIDYPHFRRNFYCEVPHRSLV
jgi:hypothetical protein